MSDEVRQEDERPASEPPVPLEAALAANAPRIYANGFGVGMTNADVFIILQQFGRPTAVLSISYTLAKTLAEKLSQAMGDWEDRVGHPLATTVDIQRSFEAPRE